MTSLTMYNIVRWNWEFTLTKQILTKAGHPQAGHCLVPPQLKAWPRLLLVANQTCQFAAKKIKEVALQQHMIQKFRVVWYVIISKQLQFMLQIILNWPWPVFVDIIKFFFYNRLWPVFVDIIKFFFCKQMMKVSYLKKVMDP